MDNVKAGAASVSQAAAVAKGVVSIVGWGTLVGFRVARKGVASVARLAWRASGGKGKGVEEEKESGNEDEKTRSMETESVTFVRSGRSGGTASGIAARPRDLSSRIAARP